MKSAIVALAALTLASGPVFAKTRPVVIGYLPTFRDYNAALDATDLSKLTHINIAFVNPAPDGSIVSGDMMACSDKFGGGMVPLADIRAIVARAHKAHVKVLVSLGAATSRPARVTG
ncbi:MAG: glycosyl hydrolase family 18 protein [Asticcacaulis sp.]